MHALRNAKFLARWVLVWFALSVGVAVASPLVQPKAMELICSAAGVMKLQPVAGDSSAGDAAANMLDCPLCLLLAAPPPVAQAAPEPYQALAHATRAIPSAHIASRTAAALPARGPPQFS